MTTEVQRLAALMQQAYDGEPGSEVAWHGPSISALTADLTARQALRRAHPDAHSIWELVLHMAFWDEVCVRRLKGARLSVTTGSPGDWPALPGTTNQDWKRTLERARRARASLVRTVRRLRDADLERTVPEWGWTFHTMIHGTLHHDLYHAGQIAMIAKRR